MSTYKISNSIYIDRVGHLCYYVIVMKEIQKPYYNSAMDPLGQFVVAGEVSTDHIEALQADLKRQALLYLGQEALRGLGHASVVVGKAVFNGLDQLVASANAQYR